MCVCERQMGGRKEGMGSVNERCFRSKVGFLLYSVVMFQGFFFFIMGANYHLHTISA